MNNTWKMLSAAVLLVTLAILLSGCTPLKTPRTGSATAAKPVIKPVPAEILNARVKFHAGYGTIKDRYYFVGDSSSSIVPEGYIALYPVKVNGLLGFINKAGNMVIEPQFSSVGGCSEGLQLVSINDNNSVIPGTDDKERYSGFLGEDGN